MANILIIIPYEFYPPRFGGALRCFHILNQIAKQHQVILYTVHPFEDFTKESIPKLPANIKIVSRQDGKKYRSIFNLLPSRYADAINCRILQRKLFKPGHLYLLDSYNLLKYLFSTEKIDFVLYENMQCFEALYAVIKRFASHACQIFDAHNVDSELWKAQSSIGNNPILLNYSKAALSVEQNLHHYFDLCFCCSEQDKNKLDILSRKKANLVVIPNGVDTTEKKFDPESGKNTLCNLLFCGTLDYGPNTEGLLWFHSKIFPLVKAQLPQVKLTVVGKMHREGPYEELKSDASVNFEGFVEDVAPYYRQSSLLIVPLLKGSGTRLKILEAMSMGNPVVSTAIGAEGIEAKPGKHYMLADTEEAFARAIVQLLQDSSLFEAMRKEARKLVEKKYDWNSIGLSIHQAIHQLQ